MNAYMHQYQNNSVMTASPEKILIMLYDGAIRFVRQSKQAIEAGRHADKAHSLSKAIAIITEFSNTLDYEIGGEIALDLSRLYDFMVRELVAVNAHNDVQRLAPVENILLELREAFVGAIAINSANAAPQAATAPAGYQRLAASC